MSSVSTEAGSVSAAMFRERIERVRSYFESRDLIRRGICYLHAGMYSDAATLFLAAREKHADSPALSSLLASSYVGQGQFASAAEELKAVAAQDPNDVQAQSRSALAHWRAGKRHQAIGLLRDALKIHPDCAALHFHLGSFLASMEDWETSELHLTQAVAIDKNYVDALVNLAMLHAARQSPSEAARFLTRAQRLRPSDAKIGWLLSLAMQAARASGAPVHAEAAMPNFRDDDSRIIEELHQAMSREPEFAEAVLEEAAGDETLNRLVCEALEQLHQKDPGNPWLVYYLARTLERMGHTTEALAMAARTLELDSSFVQALVLLARLHHQVGEIDSAKMYLERAVTCGVEYADLYFLLGNLYREQGEMQQARSAYERALGINGRYEAARQALSTLAA